MVNDINGNDSLFSKRKSTDLLTPKNILKGIALAVLVSACVFLVFTYFNSGLSYKTAEEVITNHWNKENGDYLQLEKVKILDIKKSETNSYTVKVSFSYWESPCEKNEETGEQKELPRILKEYKQYWLITKGETGWFVSFITEARNYEINQLLLDKQKSM